MYGGSPKTVSEIYKESMRTRVTPLFMKQAIDRTRRTDELTAQCVKYVESQGWIVNKALHDYDGPRGDLEFRKPYSGSGWKGHGYSVQSLSCVMAHAVRKRYPYASYTSKHEPEDCPDFIMDYCYKYMDIVGPLLTRHVRACVTNNVKRREGKRREGKK